MSPSLGDWTIALAAWGAASFWILCLIHTSLGALFIPRMPKTRAVEKNTAGPSAAPQVSIIFAYRDEKDGILAACRSMLAQDHPNLEVIAVNDRSTDSSASVLNALAADPRLKRLTVDRLPSGWLGKNHALQRGADAARGEWLIFTDADVVFDPSAVTRALAGAERYRAEHLALMPDVTLDGVVAKIFYRTFAALFAVRFWPWASRFGRLHGYAGIGAFNMTRRSVYRAIGEHHAIAMEVADDLMLAKRVKDSGGRLMVGSGEDLIRVRWFVGFTGMMRSIHKNAFRGFNYRPEMVLAAAVFLTFCAVTPVVSALSGSTIYRAAAAVSFASMFLLQFGFSRKVAENVLLAALMPGGLMLFVYLIIRSAWDALRDQAVTWRGTRYPLKLLRQSPPL